MLPLCLFLYLMYLFRSDKLTIEDKPSSVRTIYDQLNPIRRMTISANFINLLRRVIFVIVVIFLVEHVAIQILFFNILSLCMCSFLIYYHPFIDPVINKQEVFNEMTVLLIADFVFIFTDYVPDSDIRY